MPTISMPTMPFQFDAFKARRFSARDLSVRLAPAGKQKLSDIKHEMGSQRVGLVAGFTDDELQQLRHLCLKLVRNLAPHHGSNRVAALRRKQKQAHDRAKHP